MAMQPHPHASTHAQQLLPQLLALASACASADACHCSEPSAQAPCQLPPGFDQGQWIRSSFVLGWRGESQGLASRHCGSGNE